MGQRIGGQWWNRWKSSIRDVVVLIAVVEFLAWLVRRSDSTGDLLKHWPLVAAIGLPVLGLVWSIARIYRVEPRRQTLSIVVLVASLLGLMAGPMAYSVWIDRMR